MKNIKKFFMVVAVVLVTVVATSGCIFSGGVSADDIKNYTLNSAENVTSYEFMIFMNMETTSDMEGASMDMYMNGNGAVDIKNSRFMMDVSSTTSIPSMEDTKIDFTYYLINESMYMKIVIEDTEQWIELNLSEYGSSWSSYDQMQMQIDLLEEVSNVERLDDTSVNNEDCYVIKIVPDINKLFEMIIKQQDFSSITQQSTSSYDMLEDMIKNVEFTLAISKNTNFIMEVSIKVSMEISMFGYSTYSKIEETLIFINYNQPVSIELPEDAKGAKSYTDYISGLSGFSS